MATVGSGTFDDPIVLENDELEDQPESVTEGISAQDGEALLLKPYQEPPRLQDSELHEYRFHVSTVILKVLSKVLGSRNARLASRNWLGKHRSSQRGEHATYAVDCAMCMDEVSNSNDLRFGICGHAAHQRCWSGHFRTRGTSTCHMCREVLPSRVRDLFHGSWLRPGRRELQARLEDDRLRKKRNHQKLAAKKKLKKSAHASNAN